MQIYRFFRVVFGILTFYYQTVESALLSMKVEFNGTAVLPCSKRCSGTVRWTMSQNPSDILAECDRTSCRSVKKGYQMIHDQYLKGNLSLIITEADFSKRSWYTCYCDGRDICDVSLRLEPPEFSQQIKAGESLTLDFPVSDLVHVMFSRTEDTNNVPVKVFEGSKIWCNPVYEERAVLGPQLKELKNSDSGVYTLVDTKNEEVVAIYRITVTDNLADPPDDQDTDRNKVNVTTEEKMSWNWKFWEKYKFFIGLGVGVVPAVLLGFFGIPKIMRLWRLRRRLMRWLRRRVRRLRGDDNSDNSSAAPAGDGDQSPGSEGVPLKKPVSD